MQSYANLIFRVLLANTSALLVHCLGNFFIGEASGPTKKATGNNILLYVLCYGVMSWFISQGNQIGYDSGGGIMNYTL